MSCNKIRVEVPNQDTTWLDNEHGVRSNHSFATYYPSDRISKIKIIVITIFREFVYAIKAGIKNSIGLVFGNKHAKLTAEKTNSQALIIFFHGLNGKPSVWNDHIDEFKRVAKDNPEFTCDLFAPSLPKKGHVAVDDAEIEQLFDQVKTWAEKNPGKPIKMFGQSNGCRFALQLETLLRTHAPQSSVELFLTAPVLYGTSLIQKCTNMISPEHLATLSLGLLTPTACRELASGSDSSKKLLAEARKPIVDHIAKRKYRLFAASYDSHVLELGSSLPILNKGKNEKHYLVPGYGHNSIVGAFVAEHVAKCFHSIKKEQNHAFTKSNCDHCFKTPNIEILAKQDMGLMEVKDSRPTIIKIRDLAKALFNHIAILCKKMIRRFASWRANEKFLRAQEISPSSYAYTNLPWRASDCKESAGLYLCIHGLRGSTTDFKNYYTNLSKENPHAHVLAPHVALEGNCSLEIAGSPLLRLVEDYLEKFPGKPITLIGTSNGARIASYIETKLEADKLGDSCLSIVSLAGVHYGTKLIDLLDRTHLLPLARLDKKLSDEFHWASASAKQNLSSWQDKQREWKDKNKKIRHLFCATTEDEQVRSLGSSLPTAANSQNARYRIYTGETHLSIVDAACVDVLNWIKRY